MIPFETCYSKIICTQQCMLNSLQFGNQLFYMQGLHQMNASKLPNHIICVQYLEEKSFRSAGMFHLTRTQKGFYFSKKPKGHLQKSLLCLSSFLKHCGLSADGKQFLHIQPLSLVVQHR